MSGIPTIRKWWAGHWQVLGCPCDGPAGKHGFPSHAEAIKHIDYAYDGNWIARTGAHQRAMRRLIFPTPKHSGGSFIKEPQ